MYVKMTKKAKVFFSSNWHPVNFEKSLKFWRKMIYAYNVHSVQCLCLEACLSRKGRMAMATRNTLTIIDFCSSHDIRFLGIL